MLGEIIILDRNKKINARLTPSIYFDYSYKMYLETGAETFDFSVVLNEELEKVLIEKNFVLFIRNNKYKMFQIMGCRDEESYDNVIRNIESEMVGLELANSFVRPAIIEGNMTKLLTTILQDTNYKVGYVSPALDTIVASTEIKEPTSVYKVIQDSIANYNNCEFEFDVKCNDSVNGDYELLINCYADGERGNKTYKRFDYDFNSYGMSRSSDATEFCSGLIGVGANGITFKDINWDEGEGAPLSKPAGQDFLLDPEAHAMFSNGDKYILGKYTSDTTNPVELLWETYNKLQEIKKIKYSYEIPIYLTDEEYNQIEIGDTNYIVNDKFNPPIQLEARISELELTDGNNKATFSNYKEVKSGIRSLDPNDIMNSVLDSINQVKALTQSDILALQKYLMDMDIQDSEVNRIFKNIVENMDDSVEIISDANPAIDDNLEYIDPSSDSEDYKIIKVNSIDNGLFIGDKRVYDIKDKGVANITVEMKDTYADTITVSSNNSKNAQQYEDALQYYRNFNFGTNQNSSSLENLISSNNKYKIPTMVRYWSQRFGLDPYLVYAVIMAESSGNPSAATKSSAGGYGIMQCERGAYFNIKQTIKFLDGTTQSFTPSYDTLRPGSGGYTTINGVSVDKNISNQIMFGCNELRQRAEDCHFNIFALLMGYNMGMGGVYWCVTHYIKDAYGIPYYGGNSYRGLSKQSSEMKAKYYEVLDSYKAPFAAYRKQYVSTFNEATASNIELYLKWYKSVDGQLPYFLDKNGKKIGYGVNTPSQSVVINNEQSGNQVRDKIVSMARRIVGDHVDRKIATYHNSPRTVDYNKPKRYSGTLGGIKNPVCYDCSSLASCAYLAAGLNSVYNKSCSAGTLVKSATSKSGWKAWKCTSSSISEAKPGDLVMDANSAVTDSKIRSNPNYCSTHHVMVYLGDGKVGHASGHKNHPNAIKISTLDYYINKGSAFFLRPWDLAEADKKVTTPNTPSGSSGSAGNAGTVNGNDIPSKIYNFCSAKGCSKAVCCGIIANAECESSFKTSAVNKSSGASGLFQWLGDRLTSLKRKAKAAGKSWTDADIQLQHMWDELTGEEASTVSLLNKRCGGIEGFKAITDPYKAGYEFGKCFERGGYNEKRGNKAIEWYNKINPTISSGGGSSSGGSSSGTGGTEEVVIYRDLIYDKTITEITLKGVPQAVPGDYKDLIDGITINNVADEIPFPQTAPYIFLHFGINNLTTYGVQDYKDLINALLNKYPKKPIFVAKELHVNSTYPDYETVNETIDAFNSQIIDFCNTTKYVIALDISDGLVDSNGQILSSLSDDGYSFKDKDSVDKYYTAVKNAILNISKGQIIDSDTTSITLTAQSQKTYNYSNPVESLTLKLPSRVVESFYSRLIFTTSANSIRFVQPATLYMKGDDCINGAFTPRRATKYIINIFTNVSDNIGTKYYASVTAMVVTKTVRQEGYVKTRGSNLNVRTGASTSYRIIGKLPNGTKISIMSKTSNNWYKIYYKNGSGYVSGDYVTGVKDITEYSTDFTNYADFRYRDTLVNNAKSFYNNRHNFVYNNTCAFDYDNPAANKDKWITNNKYHIDDNFFTQLCMMGYNFDTCNLETKTNRNKYIDASWALPYISSESKLARYFVENDWVLDDIDYDNYSNVEPGDVLFYDSDSTNNNEFMGISHTAICVGKVNGVISMIEANNGSEPIRIIPISDRGSANLCFVGRIKK